MIRASIFALIVTGACLAACSSETLRTTPDAPTDAPPELLGSGSGSDDMAGLEPSPHDRNLELVVVASSLVVVVGPVIGSRRRRRIPNTF